MMDNAPTPTSAPEAQSDGEEIRSLAAAAGRAVRDLAVGAVKTALRAIPWLIRAISAGVWGYGMLRTTVTVAEVYGKHTPKIPLYALAAVPAIVGLAAPAYWVVERQKQNIWGAFLVSGLFLWAAGDLLRQNWRLHPLEVALAPFALAAFAHAYLILNWRFSLRQPTP